MSWDRCWLNINLATFDDAKGYGIIHAAAIAIEGERIAWIGKMADLNLQHADDCADVITMSGEWVLPGFIDCHTHLIYAGSRANEFEMLLHGKSYEEIAKLGGGIQATVNATRQADEETLFQLASRRLRAKIEEGVSVVEIKSGYGLDRDTELKMLRVAQRLENEFPITIEKTFLGAHKIPQEFQNRGDEYVEYLCDELIPQIAREKLANAVDVFCESIAFSITQTKKIFECAKQHQLKIKCHAEQLTASGAAVLASTMGALSVDHIEHLDAAGVIALAKNNTCAVLLPGAFYFLRERQKPPIDLLRKHQVPMAIASDTNPGSCPTTSLLLMLNMACTLWQMTPEEALRGITINAAKALAMDQSRGSLHVGKRADFSFFEIDHPRDLAYSFGSNSQQMRIFAGELSQ